MKSRVIRRALVGAGVLVLSAVPLRPAGASVNDFELVVQGSGTIAPGLSLVPQPQSWTATAVVTSAGTRNKVITVGTSFCSANGTSTVRNIFTNNSAVATVPETTAYGAGSGTWSCTSGPLAGKSGKLLYERQGPALEIELTDGEKPANGYGTLKCVFVPNTPQPTTSFVITCEGEYVDLK